MDWIVSSQNSDVEVLTPNVMIFWGSWWLYKKRMRGISLFSWTYPRKLCRDTMRRQLATCHPRREHSPAISPAGTLMLDLPASQIVRKYISVVSATKPSPWHFVWHPELTNNLRKMTLAEGKWSECRQSGSGINILHHLLNPVSVEYLL